MTLQPLLGFAAGGLSILSPCVLPLAPMVLAASLQKGRLGPLALVTGLVFSFVATGYAVASFGFDGPWDRETVRAIGGGLLLVSGLVLLSSFLQDRFATLLSPLTGRAASAGDRMERWGLVGQVGIGVLMGVVWSPCAGPTLGAAIGMAAGSGSPYEAGAILGAFGVGAAAPLLAIGYGTGAFLQGRRKRLAAMAHGGKRVMGGAVALIGVLILTGADKGMEAVMTGLLPDWWIGVTTKW